MDQQSNIGNLTIDIDIITDHQLLLAASVCRQLESGQLTKKVA